MAAGLMISTPRDRYDEVGTLRVGGEMKWHIRGSAELGALHDEFVESSFRVILQGNRLEVGIEVTPVTDALVESANALAQRYVDALQAHLGHYFRAMTEGEYLDLPISALQNEAMMELPFIPADKHSREKLRAARHRLISYAWPLKACYEYAEYRQARVSNGRRMQGPNAVKGGGVVRQGAVYRASGKNSPPAYVTHSSPQRAGKRTSGDRS